MFDQTDLRSHAQAHADAIKERLFKIDEQAETAKSEPRQLESCISWTSICWPLCPSQGSYGC